MAELIRIGSDILDVESIVKAWHMPASTKDGVAKPELVSITLRTQRLHKAEHGSGYTAVKINDTVRFKDADARALWTWLVANSDDVYEAGPGNLTLENEVK